MATTMSKVEATWIRDNESNARTWPYYDDGIVHVFNCPPRHVINVIMRMITFFMVMDAMTALRIFRMLPFYLGSNTHSAPFSSIQIHSVVQPI